MLRGTVRLVSNFVLSSRQSLPLRCILCDNRCCVGLCVFCEPPFCVYFRRSCPVTTRHTSISRRLHQSSRARPHALARRAAGPGKGHSIDSSFPIAHRSGVDRGACACARARARAHVRLRVPTPSASRPRRPRRARRRASLLAPHACRCSRRAPPVRGRRSELRPRTPSRAARLLSPVNTSSRHDGDTGWHTAHDKTASMHKIAWRAP